MFTFKFFHIPRILSRSYCTQALKALSQVISEPQVGTIHLIAISSEEMARMNQQYRGKEGPTDILTFSYRNKMNNEECTMNNEGFLKSQNSNLKTQNSVAGEIYLCPERIRHYAEERGVTYREQFEYIIIHGLVHLMGYDHETEEDYEVMRGVEREVMRMVGK